MTKLLILELKKRNQENALREGTSTFLLIFSAIPQNQRITIYNQIGFLSFGETDLSNFLGFSVHIGKSICFRSYCFIIKRCFGSVQQVFFRWPLLIKLTGIRTDIFSKRRSMNPYIHIYLDPFRTVISLIEFTNRTEKSIRLA